MGTFIGELVPGLNPRLFIKEESLTTNYTAHEEKVQERLFMWQGIVRDFLERSKCG